LLAHNIVNSTYEKIAFLCMIALRKSDSAKETRHF